jgi:hypothetical protein
MFISKKLWPIGSPRWHTKSSAQLRLLFIKGRLILDGALSLHEIIHELKSRGSVAILLKLDFEKPMIESAGRSSKRCSSQRKGEGGQRRTSGGRME